MARIDDGFSTLVTFATKSAVHFYEKEVTPVGISGGGENDVTTMHNTAYRTRSPKKLKTLTEMSFSGLYDGTLYNDIIAMINVNQQITIHFPDGHTLTFWGWVNEFKPSRIVEGEAAMAELTIIASNHDNSANEVEQAPVYA